MTDAAASAARLLALLALLQSRPSWPGPELAERLGVTTRTIRNDIDRLRELDYPVEGLRGSVGGYRLGAGGRLPPLLLDDEEAVAVAIGLRAAASISGIEDAGARALTKLEQVLPSRLRPMVEAIANTVEHAPENTATDAPDPEVDPEVLRAIATAIRAVEWFRFEYDDSPRLVEPYRVLAWQRRWYLVGRDPDSGQWDVYRVDRIRSRMRTRRAFTPRLVPGGDYAAFAMRRVSASGWNVHARLRIPSPASAVMDRINPAVGAVEQVSDSESVLVTGADSLDTVAAFVGMLGMDFTIDSPPELRERVRVLGERYARAAGGGTT
jgi:predicted DNA-binding transcriptional regulator YafY